MSARSGLDLQMKTEAVAVEDLPAIDSTAIPEEQEELEVTKSGTNTPLDKEADQKAIVSTSATVVDANVAIDDTTPPAVSTSVPGFNDVSDFPALPKTGSAPGKPNAKSAPVTGNLRGNKLIDSVPGTIITKEVENQWKGVQAPSLKASKRQHPGKLDIPTAAQTILTHNPTPPLPNAATPSHLETSTPVTAAQDMASTPSVSSRPNTPGVLSETPIKRVTQPRTIRVLPTPVAETPSPSSAVSTTSTLPNAARPSLAAVKDQPRQLSHASIVLPGTPTSEKISDNASMTTESISRAGSPLPTRVGSAPVRAKTKSQQKKERQEKAKALAEEKQDVDQDAAKDTENAVQEPIMGRKKKSKKAGGLPTGTSTPDSSRPASPGPQVKVKQADAVEVPKIAPISAKTIVEAPAPRMKTPPRMLKTEEVKKPVTYPTLTIAQLEASGELDAAATEFFKAAVGMAYRADINANDLANLIPLTPLTTAELSQLDSGEAVRRGGADGRNASRVLITESRRLLGGLSKEMEERYIELEKRVMTSKPPLKYASTRSEGVAKSADDILRDVAAALVRPTTTNSAAVSATNHAKLSAYADDALAYLNQFILPPITGNGKGGKGNAGSPPIGSAIPRTYTTGDPTYSVSGVDISSSGLGSASAASHKAEMMNSIGADLVARGQALMNAMGGLRAEDAEAAMLASRKESENLEKRLIALMKRNKRLAFGNGSH